MKYNIIGIIILVILCQSTVGRDNPEGYIYTTDTVTREHIAKKIYDYKVKVPLEFYLGAGIGGDNKTDVKYIKIGFMVKQGNSLHGVYTGLDANGYLQYGVQSYWRIGRKKK